MSMRVWLGVAVVAVGMAVSGAARAQSADWPMAGYDVRRVGATPTVVRPPFHRKWYRDLSREGLMMGCQPVVAAGKVYIGTMRGILHCMDDADGADVWTHSIPYGIFHSPAVADGVVYVSGGDGKLHALDAATGDVKWVAESERLVPLAGSPLPWQGRVYVASRDGIVYAINAADGTIAWRSPADGPIVQSLALDPEANRLYVGAEDMCAYAFDAASGERLWKSEQLPGVTFFGYYPVVLPTGGVAFGTRAFQKTLGIEGFDGTPILGPLMHEFYGMAVSEKPDLAGRELPALPGWMFTEEQNRQLRAATYEKWDQPDFWSRQFAFIRDKQRTMPNQQTLFLLDGATGRSRGIVPAVPGEGNAGTQHPPIVLASGKVVMPVVVGSYDYNSQEFAYLDPQTGDAALVVPPSRQHPGGSGLRYMPDCTMTLAGSGDTLVVGSIMTSYAVAGLDTATGRPIGSVWAYNTLHEPQFRRAMLPVALRQEPFPVMQEHVPRGPGVYGGGTGVDTPITIAGRSLYIVPSHESSTGGVLVAWEMSDTADSQGSIETAPIGEADRAAVVEGIWDLDMHGLDLEIPGTARTPNAERAAAAADVTDAELDRILFEAGAPKVPVDQAPLLREKLQGAVRELLSADWASLACPEGKYPRHGFWAFDDPSEVLLTLSYAWPFLTPELQAEAKAYAARQLATDPIRREYVGHDECQARERYQVYITENFLHSRTRRPGLERLYPIWAYAQASGDWQWIRQQWPQLRGLLDGAQPAGWRVDGNNGYLSGLIAYVRIAAAMDDREALDNAVPRARQALRERLAYELAHDLGGVFYPASGERGAAWEPARWMFLTPEVGRLCRTHAGEAQQRLVSRYVDGLRPSFYLYRNIFTSQPLENCNEPPIFGICLYQAKALLVDTPAVDLAHMVDVPWCKADLYYITRLALAIRAHGTVDWQDVRE